MGRIEQAIFTSARTNRSVGYQVIATSFGVGEADRRALAVWGPSHDSLLDTGRNALSYNFFPLPSGAYCISRTCTDGWEFSGRGGAQVYTHCLLVHPDTLLDYGNHPLVLAKIAEASGAFDMPTEAPAVLEPLELNGLAPIIHQTALSRLAGQVGTWQLALLVQVVMKATDTVAVASQASPESLISGLLDCLQIPLRMDVPFSTGLRHSSRRPFRIIPLPDDLPARRWLARQPKVTILDLTIQKPCDGLLVDPWAQFIEEVLSKGQIKRLADELSHACAGPSVR